MSDDRPLRSGRAARREMRSPALAVAMALLFLVPSCGSMPGPDEVTGPSSSASPSTSPAAAPEWDAATMQRLDQEITRTLQQTGAPGVMVGLWSPRGSYVRAFGVADKATGAPMQTDFFMRIGSETKTFTVTAILQLVDEGKIGLDDPISKYVPDVPEGDRITLRQLARMQSGLFNYSLDERFQRDALGDPQQSFTPEQLLQYAFSHPLVFPPGTSFQYSNTNTVLLGLVVEKVSGQSLPDYLQQKVFTPLGLEHTSFPTTNALPDPHPQGYTRQTPDGTEAVATDWNPSWAWAAGAMISDLEDLHTWAPALATGRLLKPQTQAQRLETVPLPGLPPEAGVGYGLGLFEAAGWIGHNGSLPGYQSLTVYLPTEQISLVVLLNGDSSDQGQTQEPSTAFGNAITGVITPGHVFTLGGNAPDPSSSTAPSSPQADPEVSTPPTATPAPR